MSDGRVCRILHFPGLTDYAWALELQRQIAHDLAAGELHDDRLLLLEHPHVITLGRGARDANIVTPVEALATRGVTVYEVERGGDVTYHGPGQLVGYPIIDLARHKKDLHWYLRRIEETLIRALAPLGIEAGRRDGYTGVWVEDRKIASIGVHVSRWVTWHGFALNVTTDLAYFDLIVPCGIPAVRMTSVARETGREVSVADLAGRVATELGAVFDLEMRAGDLPQPPNSARNTNSKLAGRSAMRRMK